MTRTLITSVLALGLILSPGVSAKETLNSLAAATKEARTDESQHQSERRALAAARVATMEQRLTAEQQRLADLKAEVARLSAQFSANERELAEQEKTLHLATGAMGEVYGVVRQVGNELQGELARGPLGFAYPERIELVAALAESKALPELAQLQQLPQLMRDDIRAGAEIVQFDAAVAAPDGSMIEQPIWRLGPFSLVAEQGYVQPAGEALLSAYERQPEIRRDAAGTPLTLDPTMGELLAQHQLSPTLADRLEHGGMVGKVILCLLGVGLLIALVRGASLVGQQMKLRRQLNDETAREDNALGRILLAYQKHQHHSLDAMELKLSEAIVAEQQGMERGLSMLKLLAAIAPMLGLLGTVTGMIATFQVITQYGNGDPKVMAGGISMALMTTVLGLIAAMPLLLAHNLLNSRVASLRSVLEKESLALVADFAERQEK